jgi:hypothetical protein
MSGREGPPKSREHSLDFSSGDGFACIDRGYSGFYRLKLFRRGHIFVTLQLAVAFGVRGHEKLCHGKGFRTTACRLR